MKLALISAVLFLLSYVAVNRGLGPQPLLLIVPLSVAIGSALAARWLMARRRGSSGEKVGLETDFPDVPPPQRHVPQDRASPPRRPSTGSPGGKARKLF